MALYIFLALASVTLGAALYVVLAKNPIHSVLSLIVMFFSIAGHYILLGAQFLAIVNTIVYAGAIMVLFLFVIMLLNLNAETEPHKTAFSRAAAIISGLMLLGVIAASLRLADAQGIVTTGNHTIGTIENLGKVLFNEFLLPFEVSSVLFLSAMIGAVVLGKKQLAE